MCSHIPNKGEQIVIIMVTTGTSPVEDDKRKTRMGRYLILSNQKRIQKNTARTGPGLSRRFTLLNNNFRICSLF